MNEPLQLVRHRHSGKRFLAFSRKLPWKGNDLAWFRPMKFLWFKWEKVYNKKDIEVIESKLTEPVRHQNLLDKTPMFERICPVCGYDYDCWHRCYDPACHDGRASPAYKRIR